MIKNAAQLLLGRGEGRQVGQAGPDEGHGSGSGTGQALLGANDPGQAGPSGAGRVEPERAEAERGRAKRSLAGVRTSAS